MACIFAKNVTPRQEFSFELCKMVQNTYLVELLWIAASDIFKGCMLLQLLFLRVSYFAQMIILGIFAETIIPCGLRCVIWFSYVFNVLEPVATCLNSKITLQTRWSRSSERQDTLWLKRFFIINLFFTKVFCLLSGLFKVEKNNHCM